ncbi:MAG TPA: hypothetical protein VFN35_07460 [Ktedonobacteraceae bacterium]|nr:hypothetical protein [Ktedonobacteraceae bacterium]
MPGKKFPGFLALLYMQPGAAYAQSPFGNRTINLIRAIGCLQEALRFWTPETNPLRYAGILHNMGAFYLELSTGDQATNEKKAMICF